MLKASELVEQLLDMKNQHGDFIVVDSSNSSIYCVEFDENCTTAQFTLKPDEDSK